MIKMRNPCCVYPLRLLHNLFQPLTTLLSQVEWNMTFLNSDYISTRSWPRTSPCPCARPIVLVLRVLTTVTVLVHWKWSWVVNRILNYSTAAKGNWYLLHLIFFFTGTTHYQSAWSTGRWRKKFSAGQIKARLILSSGTARLYHAPSYRNHFYGGRQ